MNYAEWDAKAVEVKELTIFQYVPDPRDVLKALDRKDHTLVQRVTIDDVKLIVTTFSDLSHQLALRALGERTNEATIKAWDQGVEDMWEAYKDLIHENKDDELTVDHYAMAYDPDVQFTPTEEEGKK